jgi:hypothetical protein
LKGGEKNMPSLDRFSQGLADPQEARVVGECAGCGGEIYEGEEVWEVDGDLIHYGSCETSYLSEKGFRKVAV